MSISKSDLGRSISDLEGKNSKFRRLNLLRGVPKNISVRFYRFPIKTVGGVRKSTKKCLKLTSLAPAPVEPKIGQPRNVCPEVTFSKIHLPYQFRDNRTSGKWSKGGYRQTDRRSDGRSGTYVPWTYVPSQKVGEHTNQDLCSLLVK